MNAAREIITDGQARRIASHWYYGQRSALLSLSSTGAIDLGRVLAEIAFALRLLPPLPSNEWRELRALEKYVRALGPRPEQPEWLRSWDESPVSADHV